MLVAFSVENYRSFKDRVTFSMVAADIKSRPPELDATNRFEVRDTLTLLTSAAIYGANASGKSNLVAALAFMRSFILNSSRETRLREPIAITPYRLSTQTEAAPSSFEVVFVQQGIIYRYGFLVSQSKIEQEWLYATKGTKEGYLFERNLDHIKVNERSFKEGKGLEDRTRPNALFLSVATQWNGKRAGLISDWFEKLVVNTGIEDRTAERRLVTRYAFEDLSPEIIAFVRELDLGIEDIQLDRDSPQLPLQYNRNRRLSRESQRLMLEHESDYPIQMELFPDSTRILTAHTKYDAQGNPHAIEFFDLFTHESHGTRRLFTLAEPILQALHTGSVLVIDEIDARLHPLLTSAIVRLFNTPTVNSKHAQLVFTTHDTNLLADDLFRRDQIWFVEKSRHGESTLYSLVEYKVRNDVAFEKNYIAGRYGAIPYLGSLGIVIGDSDAEQAAIKASLPEEAESAPLTSNLPPATHRDAG